MPAVVWRISLLHFTKEDGGDAAQTMQAWMKMEKTRYSEAQRKEIKSIQIQSEQCSTKVKFRDTLSHALHQKLHVTSLWPQARWYISNLHLSWRPQ